MTSFRRAVLFVALAASNLNGVSAFAPSKAQVVANGGVIKSSTARDMKTKQPPAAVITEKDKTSYGEVSRQYRRTVYTHNEWVKHRSPDRFGRNLGTFASSGIFKNLSSEVLTTTTVATFIVLWNCLTGSYQDLAGVAHDGPLKDTIIPMLTLPLTPFTLLSPSLGLLLVFRTNTSYQRWDEARKNWGMNINHTRDLVRMGNAYYDRTAVSEERAQEDLDRLALCTWSFVRSMKRHLSPEWEDEEDFKKELFEKLPKDQAQNIIDAAHRPNRALQDLSSAIENLPMHVMRRNEVHAAATIFEDNLGSSERLLSSPVPVFYSRWSARLLSFWLLLLPLGIWGPLGTSWNHVETIPVTFAVSVFLFGLEELATQLEEPFTILPMQGFCDKIYNWIFEIASFVPGDNGMPVYLYDNYNVELDGGYIGQIPPRTPIAPIVAEPKVVEPVKEEVVELVEKLEEAISATEPVVEDVQEIVEKLEAVAAAPEPVVEEIVEEVVEPIAAAPPAPEPVVEEIVEEVVEVVEPEVVAPEPVVEEVVEPVVVVEEVVEVVVEPEVAVPVAEPVVTEAVTPAPPAAESVASVMQSAMTDPKEVEFIATSPGKYTNPNPKPLTPTDTSDDDSTVRQRIRKFFKRN